MKNIFATFIGKTVKNSTFEVCEKQFIYGIIQIPINILLNKQNTAESLISRLFKGIVQSGGDVNQFCCDTILSLYNVPVPDDNTFRGLGGFIRELAEVDVPLRSIFGMDSGLYGPFGYENRLVVTAIGHKMLNDYHELQKIAEGKIHIHRELAQRIHEITDIKCIQIID